MFGAISDLVDVATSCTCRPPDLQENATRIEEDVRPVLHRVSSGCGCAVLQYESLELSTVRTGFRHSLAPVASESVDVIAATGSHWRIAGMEENWGPGFQGCNELA